MLILTFEMISYICLALIRLKVAHFHLHRESSANTLIYSILMLSLRLSITLTETHKASVSLRERVGGWGGRVGGFSFPAFGISKSQRRRRQYVFERSEKRADYICTTGENSAPCYLEHAQSIRRKLISERARARAAGSLDAARAHRHKY